MRVLISQKPTSYGPIFYIFLLRVVLLINRKKGDHKPYFLVKVLASYVIVVLLNQ